MIFNIFRIKAIWSWLKEARYAWLSILVIVIALAISLRPHTSESVIRITGLILQLLGIGTVIWGISETRKLFGHPSFLSKAKSWLDRCPIIRRTIHLSENEIAVSPSLGKASVYQIYVAGQNPTMENRVEALEKNILSVHERIAQTKKELDEALQKTANDLNREEQSRQTADTSIGLKLEATGTGGVHISAIGALWLFVGVILSTAAIEIAEFLNDVPF